MEIREVIAVVGTLGGVLAFVAAFVVFRTAPDRRVAWRFAGLLVCEALMVLTTQAGPLYWVEPAGLGAFWFQLHLANDGLLAAIYLPAVSVLVRSKLTRGFRSNRVALALISLGAINGGFVLAFPDSYSRAGGELIVAGGVADAIGWGAAVLFFLLVLNYSFGLVATLYARHAARGPVARRQMGFLAAALVERDLTWGLLYSMALYGFFVGVPDTVRGNTWLIGALSTGGLLLYLALMTYGILSAHLFDIDLKIKWTLERGTIAAVFIAVFFMVSEGAASFLSERLGSLVGILATGALVFALAPLQRAAERLASEAMPAVQDTPEYKRFRKLQIYGEAIAEATRGGPISAVERAVLNRLRAQLELDASEATALEEELGQA